MSGNDPDQPLTDSEFSTADTFALVGHEIRAEIIQVLGDGGTFSLSEVRSRLDIDVEPSQLHYHLRQLVGHFIEQTDIGYHLNSVGHRLCWTLRAGAFNRQEEHLTVATNFDCQECQTPVEVIFDNGQVRIGCPECGQRYMKDYFHLPRSLSEDKAATFSHYKQYQTLKMLFMARKICFNCDNRLSPAFFDPDERGSLDEFENFKVVVHLGCDQCGAGWWQSVGMALRADPGLISFCHDHGVDVLSTPHWELEFAATDKHVTVHSTDPWEVALEVTFDGETLEFVVDGDLNIVERNLWRVDTDKASGDDVVLPDKTACLRALRNHRWPDGVTCPQCNSGDTAKEGTTNTDVQRYRCNACDSIFNDRTGTIFAERNLSLPEMFHIIREMEEPEPGQIAGQIDRSYEHVLDFMTTVQETRDGKDEVGLPPSVTPTRST